MTKKPLSGITISDTHGMHRRIEVPNADILIIAGDITGHGRLRELEDLNDWLGELPHKHKIIIAGNHDWCFETQNEAARAAITNAIYLEYESITIEGHKIYGSPWQPWFLDWAFNLQRGEEITAKWDMIPDDIDVLVTHGPAYGFLDRVLAGEYVGCYDLLKAIQRIKPTYHICGHIHEGYGMDKNDDTTFINSSINTARYRPTNEPIPFSLK